MSSTLYLFIGLLLGAAVLMYAVSQMLAHANRTRAAEREYERKMAARLSASYEPAPTARLYDTQPVSRVATRTAPSNRYASRSGSAYAGGYSGSSDSFTSYSSDSSSSDSSSSCSSDGGGGGGGCD